MIWIRKDIKKEKVAIWYARISTNEDMQKHSLDAQKLDIEKYCSLYWYKLKRIEFEMASWTKMIKREKLKKILNEKNFDLIVTTKIDRLARNIVDLNKIVYSLKAEGKDVVFIDNNIDTSSANGRLFLNILGSFAEFESEIISERVKRWMAEAKRKGVVFGRKKLKKTLLSDEIKNIRLMRQRKGFSYSRIAKELWYANWSVIRNKLIAYKKTESHKIDMKSRNLKISESLRLRKKNWLSVGRLKAF